MSKRRREEEKKKSANVGRRNEEDRRGGKPEAALEEERAGIHIRMCINENFGNNPLARDQRFHVTRKDHLNP